MKPSGFIEVHALCDGKVASIRADVIDAVFDNDEMDIDGAHKPAESYEEIMNMIWNAEL